MTSTLTPFITPPSPAPIIPAKRKRSTTASNRHVPPAFAQPPPPPKQEDPGSAGSTDAIHCICGFIYDDGFSIACDECGRWSHALCFDIRENGVPDEWKCWLCVPRPVDKDHAVRLQRARQKEIAAINSALLVAGPPVVANGGGGGSGGGKKRRERRASVSANVLVGTSAGGASSSAVAGLGSHTGPTPGPSRASAGPGEEEHVDIEDEWRATYVPITTDIIPHRSTRDKLRRHARGWRGVSALSLSPEPEPLPGGGKGKEREREQDGARTKVVPVPDDGTDPTASIRPPSYALHATTPIAQTALITPFTSTIVPSATYLSDPLNAYAHLGMPKPHVHLVPPPLALALDARTAGNEARFVRSGCRPNAVLRPVLCRHPRTGARRPRDEKHVADARRREKGQGLRHKGKRRRKEPNGVCVDADMGVGAEGNTDVDVDVEMEEAETDSRRESEAEAGGDPDGVLDANGQPTLEFAIFALRDIKAREEVVLGWEWDDGAVVHALPALVRAEAGLASAGGELYGDENGAGPSSINPNHLARLRMQMQNIVHSLSSTFTACACGGEAQGCALRLMEAFVDGAPLTPLAPPLTPLSRSRSHTPTHVPRSQSHSPPNAHPTSLAALQSFSHSERGAHLDLGPLIGARRGVRTRVVGGTAGGGMGGVELVDEDGRVYVDENAEGGHDGGVYDGYAYSPVHGNGATGGDGGEGEWRRKVQPRMAGSGPDAPTMPRRKHTAPQLRVQAPTPRKARARGPPDGSEAAQVHASGRRRARTISHSPSRVEARTGRAQGRSLTDGWSAHHDLEEWESGMQDTADREEAMPPKMRKLWIKRSSDALRELVGSRSAVDGESSSMARVLSPWSWADQDGRSGDHMDLDLSLPKLDPLQMPPPPIPASLDPTTITSPFSLSPHMNPRPMQPFPPSAFSAPISPFANMTLLSPALERRSIFAFSELPVQARENGVPGGDRSHLSLSPTPNTDGEKALAVNSSAIDVDDQLPRMPSPHNEPPLKPDTTGPASDSGPTSTRVRFASPPIEASPPPSIDVESPPSVVEETPPLPSQEQDSVTPVSDGPGALSDTPPSALSVDPWRYPSPSASVVSSAASDGFSFGADHREGQGEAPNASQAAEAMERREMQPKVRRSMADYAQRRRKRREEEEAARAAASPVTPVTPLPPEVQSESGDVLTPAHPTDTGEGDVELGDREIPSVEATDIKKDEFQIAEVNMDGTESEPPEERPILDGQPSTHDSTQPLSESPRDSHPLSPKLEDVPLPTAESNDDPSIAPLIPKTETLSESLPIIAERGSSRSISPPPHSPPPEPYSPERSPSPTPQGEEDGEIPNSEPPAQAERHSRFLSPFRRRPHTPPTQPRSFRGGSPPATASALPPPTHRRPPSAPPPTRHPPFRSRPVPSGPRALREGQLHGALPATGRSGASSYVPRGPLADRDRVPERHDWERGRSWSSGRGRSRGGGGGGSSWTR